MLWCVTVAAVVAAVSGQGVRYDGTPLAGNVVVVGGSSSGSNVPEATSRQPEPLLVIPPQPQGVFQGAFPHPIPQGLFLHDGVLHHGVPHGLFHHGVPHGVFHHDGVLHHGVPHGVFLHDGVLHHGVPHAVVHPGVQHGVFPQGGVSVVAPAVSQVAVPVVAPAVQQGISTGIPVIPQRTSPVTAPLLPQPVLPAPRGPLPCQHTSGTLVHTTRDNRHEYHFSWCNRPGQTFTHDQAKEYCHTLPSDGHPTGFRLISIEDHAEDSFIIDVIGSYHVPYIWTSGEKVGPNEFKWHRTFALQYTHWSNAGRLGRSQPDNADGDEDCLAVLNDVYMDGITWHDVGCSFDKYVVCERRRAYGS